MWNAQVFIKVSQNTWRAFEEIYGPAELCFKSTESNALPLIGQENSFPFWLR